MTSLSIRPSCEIVIHALAAYNTTCIRGFRTIKEEYMYTTRPKSIQIDYSFYLDLISYAFMHGDPDDPCFRRIDSAFHRKLEAMERHEFYSLYKSGATKEIRDKAREDYLEAIGLRAAYHWSAAHDVNVMRDLDAML